MVSGTSDFGILFQRSATLSGTYANYGTLDSINFPEIENASLDATNHGSNSQDDVIKSRLIRTSAFDVTFIMDSSMVEQAYDDVAASTSAWFKITYPNNASKAPWNFEAVTTKVKVANSADPMNPKVLKATVTFKPTGGILSGLT